MPRTFSSLAMDANVSAPVARMAFTTGIRLDANSSARASQDGLTLIPHLIEIDLVRRTDAADRFELGKAVALGEVGQIGGLAGAGTGHRKGVESGIVPDASGIVFRGGDDAGTIRAELCGKDGRAVPFEHVAGNACCDIPDTGGPIS